MFPAGGALFKFLATVTAFLTVTSGLPRIQCVCPDGRVKYFCHSHSDSGCCCDDPSVSGSISAAPSGCQRTLVADILAYTVEGANDGDGYEAGALVAWVGHSVAPKQTRADCAERRFLLPPSDRVVLFCHFTC